MSDIFKALAGQETAKRAISIALVGNHPLRLRPQEGAGYLFTAYDINRLNGEPGAIARAHFDRYDGAPMGLAAAADRVAACKLAMHYLAGLAEVAAPDFEHPAPMLTVEVRPVSCADLLMPPPAESGEAVAARIGQGRERRAETASWELDHNATALLANWRHHVAVTDATAAAMIEVARSIAALDKRPRYDAVMRLDLAEALSYHRA